MSMWNENPAYDILWLKAFRTLQEALQAEHWPHTKLRGGKEENKLSILQWQITYIEEEASHASKPAEDFCSRASFNA